MIAVFLPLCLLARADADVLHMRNGRKLEGQILKKTKRTITIRLRAGKMKIPRSLVRRIENAMSAKREFGLRLQAVNRKSPVELDKLAQWASTRGLGKQSRDLRSMAFGLRLERQVKWARKKGTVRAWLDTHAWAKAKSAGAEVRLWLIEQASAINGNDPKVRNALKQLKRDLARKAAYVRKLEEIAKRPRYLMPGPKHVGGSFRAVLTPKRNRRAMLRRLARFAIGARKKRARAAAKRGKTKQVRKKNKRTRRWGDPRDRKPKRTKKTTRKKAKQATRKKAKQVRQKKAKTGG